MTKRQNPNAIPPELQIWIDVRRRHHLSHAHVQMARELGMNPKKMGAIDNHRQEPWKAPLPIFIEGSYSATKKCSFSVTAPGLMNASKIFVTSCRR